MNTITINASTARWLAVNSQLLNCDVSESTGNDDIYRIIDRLGYVQIDTLTVVERAHHHTLWNRQPGYRNEVLENLLSCERNVFEYWAHAMSYVPMQDYRFYMPRMRSFFDPIGKWEKERLEKYGYLMQPVLEQLRIDGPLTSSDVKSNVEAHPGGSSWNPNPCKAALELLLLRGDVMVTERRNFQRVYDLTERVLPAGIDTRFPSDDELGRFLVKRALMAHGVVRERDISLHIDAAHNSLISKCLRQMVENNEVCMVQLEENSKIKMYVEPWVLTAASDNCEMKKTVHLLSPFDNMLFSRDRIKQLFDFDYRL
ncbi:winged helix-turn-helix domain-containing protein, partial [bacterium]